MSPFPFCWPSYWIWPNGRQQTTTFTTSTRSNAHSFSSLWRAALSSELGKGAIPGQPGLAHVTPAFFDFWGSLEFWKRYQEDTRTLLITLVYMGCLCPFTDAGAQPPAGQQYHRSRKAKESCALQAHAVLYIQFEQWRSG